MTSAFEKLNDPEEPHDSFSRHISFSRVVKQGGGPPAPKRKYEPAAPLGRAGKPEKHYGLDHVHFTYQNELWDKILASYNNTS